MMTNVSLPSRVLGKYHGKSYRRYQVQITQDGLDRDLWHREGSVEIIAESPAAAVNAIKFEFAPLCDYPTSFVTAGPKGAPVERFLGYESLIAAKMFAVRPDGAQLELFA